LLLRASRENAANGKTEPLVEAKARWTWQTRQPTSSEID
jgi:hypothetical protein